jgi:hypothetical protein
VKRTLSNARCFPLVAVLLPALCAPFVGAQSQALNGQIEGTVTDGRRAAVAGAVMTATNLETGTVRTGTTDQSGFYRLPLLPLGAYRVSAEAPLFKKFVREGITLSTGQAATIDLSLETGDVRESVTVSADASIADAGKTDLGRVMNAREVQNLPLISRNPYNYGLLQANVTGRPSRGFPFPSINANGYLRRVNFLIDGNTNTQGDRGSIRLMFISDTSIGEVQLLTGGFAAEFGNTPGLIMNVVTPSGGNRIGGAIGYRFRRPSFYSRPFFYPAAELPDNRTDILTAAIGGPLIEDRWHFYFGYENGTRDDRASASRLLTITEENKARLIAAGLAPRIFPPAIPSLERGPFYIFRTDLQVDKSHRLTVRFNHSDLLSKNQIPGGLNTLERSTDAVAVSHGLAVQLASFTARDLNEFRFQYAQRRGTNNVGIRNEFSGTSPSVVIKEAALFGSNASPSTDLPVNRITQFQDNLTRTRGGHVLKFGGGANFYEQNIRAEIASVYTFSSIDKYISARRGTSPRDLQSYESYTETFGDPLINLTATFWNFFAQDDLKLTRRLKINFGLRYDLYLIPEADPSAPFPASRKFNVDKNNFAPRAGLVYALREGDRPTILRLGAGLYYDQPLLAVYQRALQNNGNPKFFSFSFRGNNGVTGDEPSPGAPDFPNAFAGSLPPGSTLPVRQNIETVAADFVNMYAIHAHLQIEQALTENLSLAVGYVHSGGRHIPVYRSVNMINPERFLADGRAVYHRLPGPSTRSDPRFNIIQMAESVGVSRYDALAFQLTRRFSRGLQLSANYTLSKAADDAPEQNLTTGTIQGLVLSDPDNRRLDKGSSFADQRHTFVMTLVARPRFGFRNKLLRGLGRNNQFAVIASANSGERFNIISLSDLNGDGVSTADRPVGIARNSGRTPAQFNVDLRYSRFFDLTERYKLEVFGEFQNLFNINSIVQFNQVSAGTDPETGELTGQLPDFRTRNPTSQESRQLQLGVRFIF